MSKLVELRQAIDLIQDGDTIAVGGFVGNMHPEALSRCVEERFLETGKPNNLSLIYAAGQGDGKNRGLNHFGHEDLISKVIGGHWGLAPKLGKLAIENKIQAYNLPQGIISHLFRATAAHTPGVISKVGLQTFVDPRLEGGKINAATQQDMVRLINLNDEKWLFYPSIPINIAFLRGTYCDENGNCTFEKEALSLESISIAQACKNSGGKVILQVERVVQKNSLDYTKVKLPGILVDAIVEASPNDHMQTFAEQYNPSYSGEIRVVVENLPPLPLDIRKVIARRAAMELVPNAVMNLGIGMPEGVSMVASEEGVKDLMLTTEAGTIGGIPAGGQSFGAATNPDMIIDQPYQFDYYDGGGLAIAFLGLAQCDGEGNVNVSKFGVKVPGCGGFINISQNSRKVIYCGSFTAGGLEVEIKDSKLHILQEGKSKKFLAAVEQITFSGKYAAQKEQKVLYITERAVFDLTKEGMRLIEIAPGIDLQKDILDQMDFKPIISDDLKTMSQKIFKPEKIGLSI